MIDSFLSLFDRINSYQRLIILICTGFTSLLLYFGYLTANNYNDAQLWKNQPHYLKTELPCSLIQLRSNVYLISVSFPVPDEAKPFHVDAYRTSFVLSSLPSDSEFTDLCSVLVQSIVSDNAEVKLAPYHR